MITGGTLTGLLQLQQEEKDNHQVLEVQAHWSKQYDSKNWF